MTERKSPAPRKRTTPAKPKTAAPVPGLPEVVTALNASTEATNRLVTSLDASERTNAQAKIWRKRATAAYLALVVAVVLAVGYIRLDQIHDADRAERKRVETCQIRNDGQQFVRQLFVGVFDKLQVVTGIPVDVLDPLRQQVAMAEQFDTDCDRDGVQTSADYSPTPVKS